MHGPARKTALAAARRSSRTHPTHRSAIARCTSCRLNHKPYARAFSSSTSSAQHAHHSHEAHAAPRATSEVAAARAYCDKLLRDFDHPSYILRAFIPPAAQDAYLSLRALNVDVARIPDMTSNPAVGALRMQFWRDAITSALSRAHTTPSEPVALLLAHAAADLSARTAGASRLSRAWLHRLVSTREQHLASPPFADLAAVEKYAEATYSALLYLTLQALPLHSVAADHVASHIGKAQGIVALLRGVPLLAFPGRPRDHANQAAFAGHGNAQGTVSLPLDVMAEAGVREEDVLRQGAEAKGLKDAVFAVATRANDHLITARQMLENVRAGGDEGHEFEHVEDAEHRDELDEEVVGGAGGGAGDRAQARIGQVERAFGVFMPAVATQSWLDRLQKADFDVFEPRLRTGDWKLPLKTWWSFRQRKL